MIMDLAEPEITPETPAEPGEWRRRAIPVWSEILAPLESAVAVGMARIERAEQVYFNDLADCTDPQVLARAADIFEALRDGLPVPAVGSTSRGPTRFLDEILAFPHRSTITRRRARFEERQQSSDVTAGETATPPTMNQKSIAIGHRLREARKAAGWDRWGDVPRFAEACGLSKAMLVASESGHASQHSRAQIGAFLNLNMDWLERGEGEMFLAPPPPALEPAATLHPSSTIAATANESTLSQRMAAAIDEVVAAKEALAAAHQRLEAALAAQDALIEELKAA